MIKDIDTNFVYLADKLKTQYSDFFNRFTHLLNKMDIKWDLIPHTKDIWVRDFMPIQTVNGGYLQYNYKPDYLQDKRFIRLQSDTSLICKSMQINSKKTDLILDGGILLSVAIE